MHPLSLQCTAQQHRPPASAADSYPISKALPPLAFREDEMELFWLDDAQWQAIEPLLPSRQTGPKRSDDRTVISGIVHVLISGCAWRECPEVYGPSMTVFNRFNRWKRRGLWNRIASLLIDPNLAALNPEQREILQAAHSARAQKTVARTAREREQFSVYRAWDEAAVQLRKIAESNQGRPFTAWIDEVVEWHMDELFAKIERHTPNVDAAGAEFNAQVANLRNTLLGVLTSLRAYLDDPRRNAAPARHQLARLELELRQAALARAQRAS